MIPALLLLVGCPKPPPPAPPVPPSQIIPPEEPRVPPLPPPAPVELAFAWPDLSACLMATRLNETITVDKAPISTLNAVGSGVVFAEQQGDGTWGITLEDRSGTARHAPSTGELLVRMQEIQLGLRPSLVVDASGTSVLSVGGVDGVHQRHAPELEALAAQRSTVAVDLWREALPVVLSEQALAGGWSAAWADGWGFSFGKRWVVGEFQTFTATTGEKVEAAYLDVVPCKFNEDEPQCVRIELIYTDSKPVTPEARLRVHLPPGAEQSAVHEVATNERRGELVIEAQSGLPWRWTLVDSETHAYRYGAGTVTELDLKRKQEVSCDWRVAE